MMLSELIDRLQCIYDRLGDIEAAIYAANGQADIGAVEVDANVAVLVIEGLET